MKMDELKRDAYNKKLFLRTRYHLSPSCWPTVADYETPIHLLLFIIIGLLFIALQAYIVYVLTTHALSPLVGSNYYYYLYVIFFIQITLPYWSKSSPYTQLLLNFTIVNDLG